MGLDASHDLYPDVHSRLLLPGFIHAARSSKSFSIFVPTLERGSRVEYALITLAKAERTYVDVEYDVLGLDTT